MMDLGDEESNNQEERPDVAKPRVGAGSPHMSAADMETFSTPSNVEGLIGTEALVKLLHDTFDKGEIEAAEEKLKHYLSWCVPFSYKLERNMSPLHKCQPKDGKSSRPERLLFPVLDGFLNKDNELTDYLKTLEVAVPSLCGRVFKVGEPTYSCRDCGMDPTCVLCSNCFNNSGHRNHRYKISTSSGGGYCDCGDKEAWKSDPYCSLHQPVVQEEGEERKLISTALEERAKFLFRIMLQYTYEMIFSEPTLNLPGDLEYSLNQEASVGGGGLQSVINNVIDDEDLHCTVLYNDETHSFDTVISTLERALECTHRDAVDYATIVDREGRCVVKIDQFQQCYQVTQVIERFTSRAGSNPLRAHVMTSRIFAHQIFSLKIIEWTETILEKSCAFRDLFGSLLEKLKDEYGTLGSFMSPKSGTLLERVSSDDFFIPKECSKYDSLLEGVLLNDTKLWKSARSTWHHLLITGMLKDYHLKKRFATIFAKHYADIVKDFISDDHDHAFSVTSLSVQIFTVPSIAHYLIEHHDVIVTIMRTLMSECELKVNSGKLEFNRGGYGTRTNFVVRDLKYILTIPPTEWTEGLIKNFNRGMDYIIQLLCTMQEMDAVTRQTGNHMEYDPEWESAFNLQIELQPVLTLSLDWLATNKNIFIRAYRYCLRELARKYNTQTNKTAIKEFANHAAICFVYDVSTEPVSVHLPLARFFAGLHVYLDQYGLEFVSQEFQVPEKPVPEILMEPSLRTQVLVAQVHAGMWKRNGYSLLNQLHFYQTVLCRTDMMDKDILALQIGASSIEANEFLLHVLNRFDLFQWTDQTFYDRHLGNVEDDRYNHVSTILGEFLGLIINIFSARFVPRVGQVTRNDCIRKEIIQLLCIETMTHSTLSKGLVENVNHETGLEGVIEDIAVFKKSNNSGQGFIYELKPEFYKEYDWHHYHYTREEMSRAEEKQRERKIAAKEPEYFPPPVLPPFTPKFNLVVNILKSDVLLQILALVLQRSIKKTKIFNDSHLRKALHLIGHGLNEEIARTEKEEEHFFQFCEACKRWKIFELLDSLLKESHLAQHYDMILWIRKQKSKIRPSDTIQVEQTEDEVMVQPNEEVAQNANEEEKRKRARMVAEKRAKALANMMSAQQKFMAVNGDLFANDETEDLTMYDEKGAEPVHLKTVALGPNQTPFRQDDETYVCILCKEEHSLSINSKPFVLAAFIQRSSVLCETRDELRAKEVHKSVEFLEKPDVWFRRNLLLSPHVSSCGHIMHEACWASHIEGVINKESRRPYRRTQSFDVDNHEWLCPMCDCICNAALPMALALHKLYAKTSNLTEKYVVKVLQPIVTYAEDKAKEVMTEDTETWNEKFVPSIQKKAELSPDITDIPVRLPQIPELNSKKESPEGAVTQAELSDQDKRCFPVVLPTETREDHSLAYRVWLRGMKILDRFTHSHHPYEYDSGDEYEYDESGESGEDQEILDEELSQKCIFSRKLIKRLDRRGLPGERLLETFHGHTYSEHQETCNAKFYDSLHIFMERVQTVARDKTPEEPERLTYQLHRTLWHSVAYTIMAAEAYHRDQRISFFGENVPIRRSMGLKFLTRVCSVSVESRFFSTCSVLRSEFLRLLASIWHADPLKPCMLALDAFGLLVFLTYLMPFALCPTYDESIYSKNYKTASQSSNQKDGYDDPSSAGRMSIQPPVGSMLDHHNLRLVFTIHVYQLIVSMDNMAQFTSPHDDKCDCHLGVKPEDLHTSTKTDFSTNEKLRPLLFYLWAKPREPPGENNDLGHAYSSIKAHLDCDRLWEQVSQKSIPFLRCCAKFYESMTGISPPPALEKIESSFDDLISYLDLPKTLYELFDCPEISELAMRWSRHPSMQVAVDPIQAESSNDPNLKSLYKLGLPRTLPALIDLPIDYTDLINSVSLFKCAKCEPHGSRMPTMCLICGEILCSQSYCCQQELKKESMGPCTYHSYFCGGGIGIFLRIRECRLFLLRGRNKGCHILPPYLDEYGETDQGLRRGNPMTLSQEKYEYFRKLWISHAIPEEITRITEQNNGVPATQWVYL